MTIQYLILKRISTLNYEIKVTILNFKQLKIELNYVP